MLNFYQHIPEIINPISFSVGSFDVRWYSLMYLAGFLAVYLLLKKRNEDFYFSQNLILDFFLYSFLGLIIGARSGYALFYDLGYFIENPLAIISPFNESGNFVGIFGMSYHGGLIGIIIASLIFVRKNNIEFFKWSDFVIPAIPAGYFFGRIGNFLNGELYGKATSHFWGMYFSSDSLGVLRHPTQLYEAFFEGIVLFSLLWALRNKSKFPGYLLCMYLSGYGIIRFFVEFLREPEQNLVIGMTIGQILSIIMLFSSLLLFFKLKRIRSQEASS